MKHRVPRTVLLALVLLVMLALHVAILHTMVNVGTCWWGVIVGIALLVVAKTVVIIIHLRKIKRAKATSVEFD